MQSDRLREVGEWLIALSQAEDRPGAPDLDRPMQLDQDLCGGRKLINHEPLYNRIAKAQHQERSRRSMHFDLDLFGEPAWDILLDLYVSRMAGRKLSITSLCHGTQVPTTTALRWIGVLEQRGMISREASANDKRVVWVELTEKALAKMNDYFADLAGTKGEATARLRAVP